MIHPVRAAQSWRPGNCKPTAVVLMNASRMRSTAGKGVCPMEVNRADQVVLYLQFKKTLDGCEFIDLAGGCCAQLLSVFHSKSMLKAARNAVSASVLACHRHVLGKMGQTLDSRVATTFGGPLYTTRFAMRPGVLLPEDLVRISGYHIGSTHIVRA
ncbi:uncharacterized protein B0H18DRAFT_951577 [Fomitopsis serialis]|uniref:uncharacterized protein n=1 Tax=Fomitopsis serialis TaxID=139415 RepID=UPI002007B504|nr:uncharacterized protein B0H18DRAFT_951577 [Neoantrodia serialis]KAH9934202.1 hypothetical protein B0H18DRAFT_951577 [Neoantrodia serialis]